MSKPNKSIRKRIRVGKTGKLIRRIAGQNHFNAKESRRSQRVKRASVLVPKSIAREVLMRLS